jgi:integration host factor subunit alpha
MARIIKGDFMTLTKGDLINKVYNSQTTLTQKKARKAVETILRTIKSSLESNEDVLLSGFGKFSVKSKFVRKGRNPQTGESLMITARKVIQFKPSGKLREKVNGK